MRGAGCTINDMWDRDIDGKVFEIGGVPCHIWMQFVLQMYNLCILILSYIKVARTKTRPLVSGGLSMSQAWLSLAVQLSAGLAVLVNV